METSSCRQTCTYPSLSTAVAKTMGPFHDCTSNQAIAYGELSKPEHGELLSASVSEAKQLLAGGRVPSMPVSELAVEIAVFRTAHARE